MHTHLKTAKSDDLPGEVAFMGAKTSGKPDRAAPVAQPITIISPWILMIRMIIMVMVMVLQFSPSPSYHPNDGDLCKKWAVSQKWCLWGHLHIGFPMTLKHFNEIIFKIYKNEWNYNPKNWIYVTFWFLTKTIDLFGSIENSTSPGFQVEVSPQLLLKFNPPFSQTFEQSCQDDRFLWPFNLLPGFREKRQKFRDRACSWRIVLSDRSTPSHVFHVIQYSAILFC